MIQYSVTPGEGWQIYGEPTRGRSCGDCKACCTWVPVEQPLNKPAGVRCQHQSHKGCSIYDRRPDVCKYWSCMWLFSELAVDLRRPDKSGYIVDPMPQEILANHKPLAVVQIWIDPARPDAHQAHELRAFMRTVAQRYRMPALVRWAWPTEQTGAESMFLVPPEMSDTGDWFEIRQNMVSTEEMARLFQEAARGPR